MSRAGLCDHCRHAKRIVSSKGSEFTLCLKHQQDARFAKYPPLPVLSCPGFQPPPEPLEPPR